MMPPAVPVQISRCHVNYATTGGMFVVSAVPAALRITYTNVSSRTATHVVFQVTLEGRRETVEDTGTFSPHASIEHVFSAFRTLRAGASLPQPICAVSAVTFADGTRWIAPNSRQHPI